MLQKSAVFQSLFAFGVKFHAAVPDKLFQITLVRWHIAYKDVFLAEAVTRLTEQPAGGERRCPNPFWLWRDGGTEGRRRSA